METVGTTADLFPTSETRDCDQCGGNNVRSRIETQEFYYGPEETATLLSAEVPVWNCSTCDFSYTDGMAEEIRHESICRHLGVLTPNAIRELRRRHGMSQAELAELTGFGEASIKRWETGVVVQNTSADKFLRILHDPYVLNKLKAANLGLPQITEFADTGSRFRTKLSDQKRREAKQFSLTPLAA